MTRTRHFLSRTRSQSNTGYGKTNSHTAVTFDQFSSPAVTTGVTEATLLGASTAAVPTI